MSLWYFVRFLVRRVGPNFAANEGSYELIELLADSFEPERYG